MNNHTYRQSHKAAQVQICEDEVQRVHSEKCADDGGDQGAEDDYMGLIAVFPASLSDENDGAGTQETGKEDSAWVGT